jgi:uncharacterized protein
MRTLLVLLFGLWRGTVGAVLPDACRFRPTCSHYAQEALIHRGLFAGLALTAWRLLRCNPWNAGGYDPIVRSSRPCTPGAPGPK